MNTSVRTAAIDVETNNLFPMVDTIWCVCVLDVENGSAETFRDAESFSRHIAAYDLILFHNGLGFDYWALWKVWNVRLPIDRCVDTLVWSRTLWPDRPWGHSLADWGKHLGMPKGEHSDWTQYSEAMKEYCEQDSRICAAIYRELIRERDQ